MSLSEILRLFLVRLPIHPLVFNRMVSKGRPHLRYLEILGFRVIFVDDWSDAARRYLLPLSGEHDDASLNLTRRYQDAQHTNQRALSRMESRVQRRIAAEVCAAAGAPLCK